MTVREKLEKKYGTPTTSIRQQLEAKYQTQPIQPVQQTGFFQGVGQDVSKRFGGLIDTFKQTAKPVDGINPLQTGLRTVGEVAGLVGDVAGRAISAVTPEFVKSGLKKVGSEILQTDIGKQGLKVASQGLDSYSTWKKNNPQTAKDLESVVNIASLFPIGKGAKIVGQGLEQVAKVGLKGAEKVGEKVATGGKFITSQATGLSPKTIEKILKNSNAISAAEKDGLDAVSLGNKVKTALTSRIEDLRSTGKKYEIIRRSPEKVIIPETTVSETLAKYGINLNNKGKILITEESVPLKSGDIKELQSFIDVFGKKTELSGNAFMNARTSLTNLSGFGTDKSDISKIIARDLRSSYDDLGKEQLTDLAKLDAKYSSEKTALSKIKKEYLTPDGELKDNALTKITNATNEGRQSVINRLEKLIPGISEQINILKVLKDIEAVKGQKVGAYASGALKSGIGGFALTGGNPIGAIAGAIISSPQVAVPMLKAFGRLKGVKDNTINVIINKMKSGKKLFDNEMTIVNNALVKNADKFNQAVVGKTKNIKLGNTK